MIIWIFYNAFLSVWRSPSCSIEPKLGLNQSGNCHLSEKTPKGRENGEKVFGQNCDFPEKTCHNHYPSIHWKRTDWRPMAHVSGRISNSSNVKLIDWNSSKMKILKKNSSKTSPNLASGGGLVVSLLAFYSVDLSSNPAGCLICTKRQNKWKSARGWPIFLKTHRLTNPKGGGSSVAECS